MHTPAFNVAMNNPTGQSTHALMVALLVALVFALAAPCAQAVPAPAPAPGEPVAAVLEYQRTHGYPSAKVALARLQEAHANSGADAPLGLRCRYYGQLSYLADNAGEPAVAERARAQLKRMAEHEACRPCSVQLLIALANEAVGERKGRQALDYLAKARALLPADAAALHDVAALQLDALQLDALQLELAYAEVFALEAAGKLPQAVEKALAAIEQAEHAGSTAARIRLLISLVGLNADLGYTDRAMAVAEDAMTLAEPLDYREAMALVWLNRGHIHSLTGKRDRQLRALNAALKITRDVRGLDKVEVVSRSNLADYYLYRGDYRAALDQAARAAALAHRIDYRKGLTAALANVGIARSHLGQPDDGIATLRESIALARGIDNKVYVVAITGELVKVLEHAGRYREALAAMHQIAAVNEAITRQEREEAVVALQARYDAERKNRQIEQLSAQNRLNAAKVAARTWQQWLWGTAAVALALAAVVLAQWLKRSRRSNQRLREANQNLAEQSAVDPLTGAFNRRHCHKLMAQQGLLSARRSRDRDYHACIGLVLLDFDHFKSINDHYGHAAGDAVLVEVAHRLQALVREQDAVVRWGGEEFLLVLPGAPAGGVAVLARRALRTIGANPVRVGAGIITVTASAGCVAYPMFAGQQWEDALHVADQALYLAKQAGRNRAVCVTEVGNGADAQRIADDLVTAEAAGDVVLKEVSGPRRRNAAGAGSAASGSVAGPASETTRG